MILVGLAVVAVGAPLGSSAASCPPAVAYFVVSAPSSAEVGTPFTVTVTANSSCHETVKSYKGPATLRASGTNANGDAIASGAAGIADLALKFTAGTGTATHTLTATTDALNVRLNAADQADSSIAGSSPSFAVYDDKIDCGTANCSGEIPDPATGTKITVNIPVANLPGFLGLSVSPQNLAASACTTADVSAMGPLYTIAPPSGAPEYTVTIRYPKEETPGTGVANFVHCMSNNPGVDAFEAIAPCDNKNPVPKCVLDQRRTGVGELVVTFLLTPGDPVGGGFG